MGRHPGSAAGVVGDTAFNAENAVVFEAAEKVWRPSAVAGTGSFLLSGAASRQIHGGRTGRFRLVPEMLERHRFPHAGAPRLIGERLISERFMGGLGPCVSG